MPLVKVPREKEGPCWIRQANRVFVQLDLYPTIRRLEEWKVPFEKSLTIGITGRLVHAAYGPTRGCSFAEHPGMTLGLPTANTSVDTCPELLEACGFPALMP